MEQLVKVMLDMQDEMNSKVNPDWRNQGFEWYRAIWIECAELMDHHGWKWWKHQAPDDDQIRLELVDIWHFGLSIRIVASGISEETGSQIVRELQTPVDTPEFMPGVEDFARNVLQTRAFDVRLFAGLMESAGMSVEELYRRYVGKNVLNFFRQDNGYKDGSYKKTWEGREDNEHLVELMASLDSTVPSFRSNLYDSLTERYANLS